ncbi:MAG: response regulator [Vampirovibrionales bacterium]|nr:response regulator [Vampirovibrionales bacterium]
MSLQVVLVIGTSTPDHMAALKETMGRESHLINAFFLDTLENAMLAIEHLLPDLVFVMADNLLKQATPPPEALYPNQSANIIIDFCRECRETPNLDHRPVLVIQTEAQNEEERIEYLINGADDILTSGMGPEELRVRLLAHLRRNLSLLSHKITRLPGLDVAARIMQRYILQNRLAEETNTDNTAPWALMLMGLDTLGLYTERYGPVPAEQAIRTFGAMLTTLIRPPDFVGHTEADTFMIITHPDRAEKIAAILCRQFDQVVPNFYSESDRKQGYMMVEGESRTSRRVGLLNLSIGIANSQVQPYTNYKIAFTEANQMRLLASQLPQSTWISDRFKLTGGTQATSQAADIAETLNKPPTVLVVESDAALAFLLKTTLEMGGYKVETANNPAEVRELTKTKAIRLVVMDSLILGEPVGWNLCQELKHDNPHTLVILISTLHDRDKAMMVGADLYMPKPFELLPLLNWINRLLPAKPSAAQVEF